MSNPQQTEPNEAELGEVLALYDEYGQSYRAGLLYFDTNKRWALWEVDEEGILLDWEDQVEFTTGDTVDIMLGGTWLHGHFEHANREYYLLIDDTIVTPRRGLYARVRKRG